MQDVIEIQPSGPVRGRIRPPGSKSITNRALVCAALAEGTSRLTHVLDSEDTRVMLAALGQLGFGVEHDVAQQSVVVHGKAGRIPAGQANLFLANSGTSMRFLTAMVALGQGEYRLDGTPRMRERPIKGLLTALRGLGVDAQSEANNGCPPVRVRAEGMPGGTTTIEGAQSSQFLSGLLLAAPCAAGPVEVQVAGELVSEPFVEMTVRLMRQFGAWVDASAVGRWTVDAPRPYTAIDYAIEPDATAASYFFGAAAVTGGRVTVEGLSRESLQGDVRFCDCLAQMGCNVEYTGDSITVEGRPLRGIDVDMNGISDTVQTLAVVALAADGPTTIRQVGHIRLKETDRLRALAVELRKLGAIVDERVDGLRIVPGTHHGAEIDTYDDHRMAMSFSLAGLIIPGVRIRDPRCTRKTYPEYFQDLANLLARRES